jgi:hypothetical protein
VIGCRVAGSGDRRQERVTVVADPAVFDEVPTPARVEDDATGPQVVGDRVDHAAEVHRPNVPDDAVGRLVRVTGDDELRIAALQVTSELLLVPLGGDAIASHEMLADDLPRSAGR